jgi:hypothetical protein
MEITVLEDQRIGSMLPDGEAPFDPPFFLKCVEAANLPAIELMAKAGKPIGDVPGAVVTAVRSGNARVLDLILSAGGCAGEVDDSGSPALVVAASHMREDLLTLLLSAGADPEASDPRGRTALIVASGVGLRSGVSALLKAKAAPDAADASGRTALMQAAVADHTEAAEALLRGRADASLKDLEGRTAFDLAMKGGHASVAKLLKSWESGTVQAREEAAAQSRKRGSRAAPRGRWLPESARLGIGVAVLAIALVGVLAMGLGRGMFLPKLPADLNPPALEASTRSLQFGVEAVEAFIRAHGVPPATLKDVFLQGRGVTFLYEPFPDGHYVLQVPVEKGELVHDSSKGPALVSFTASAPSRKGGAS